MKSSYRGIVERKIARPRPWMLNVRDTGAFVSNLYLTMVSAMPTCSQVLHRPQHRFSIPQRSQSRSEDQL